MSPFSSPRERRLWIWALAVVVAIYASLGLAGTLAEVLRVRGLLESAFALGLLLVVVAIVANALRTRPGPRERWATLGLMAVYGMVLVRMGGTPAERTHIFEYGLVAVLIYEALKERVRNGRTVPSPAVVAVVATALLGWLDEGIQGWLPNRVYDLLDVARNALAGFLAVVATVLLSWTRRWDELARRFGRARRSRDAGE